MHYSIETKRAKYYNDQRMYVDYDTDTYLYSYGEEDKDLYQQFLRDPRFEEAEDYFYELTEERRNSCYKRQSSLAIENEPLIVGRDNIQKLLDALPSRQDAPQLKRERTHTKVDSQTPHPTKRGWSRDLDLRETQYGETHGALADYHTTRLAENTVYTTYRGYSAKLSNLEITFDSPEVFTIPIDISGKNTDFWDGTAIITATPGEESKKYFQRYVKDFFNRTYEDRRARLALVMSTLAIYWEIDRALYNAEE